MKLGTKSLLFGAHQFLWHPATVALAWRKLYGAWPNWKELLCIVVHDWGYWGKVNIDGPEGVEHPWLGAKIAGLMLGDEYFYLTLLHSRSLVKKFLSYPLVSSIPMEPSKLCWADKLSIAYEPDWFYLFRCSITGEIAEYRQSFSDRVPLDRGHGEWLQYVRNVELKKDLKNL